MPNTATIFRINLRFDIYCGWQMSMKTKKIHHKCPWKLRSIKIIWPANTPSTGRNPSLAALWPHFHSHQWKLWFTLFHLESFFHVFTKSVYKIIVYFSSHLCDLTQVEEISTVYQALIVSCNNYFETHSTNFVKFDSCNLPLWNFQVKGDLCKCLQCAQNHLKFCIHYNYFHFWY